MNTVKALAMDWRFWVAAAAGYVTGRVIATYKAKGQVFA